MQFGHPTIGTKKRSRKLAGGSINFGFIASFIRLAHCIKRPERAFCASATRPHAACARANHVRPKGKNNVIRVAASTEKPEPINWTA